MGLVMTVPNRFRYSYKRITAMSEREHKQSPKSRTCSVTHNPKMSIIVGMKNRADSDPIREHLFFVKRCYAYQAFGISPNLPSDHIRQKREGGALELKK